MLFSQDVRYTTVTLTVTFAQAGWLTMTSALPVFRPVTTPSGLTVTVDVSFDR